MNAKDRQNVLKTRQYPYGNIFHPKSIGSLKYENPLVPLHFTIQLKYAINVYDSKCHTLSDPDINYWRDRIKANMKQIKNSMYVCTVITFMLLYPKAEKSIIGFD